MTRPLVPPPLVRGGNFALRQTGTNRTVYDGKGVQVIKCSERVVGATCDRPAVVASVTLGEASPKCPRCARAYRHVVELMPEMQKAMA
jgi:hypothetical protein